MKFKKMKRLLSLTLMAGLLVNGRLWKCPTVQATDALVCVNQFMDCFCPMPIIGELSNDCWGAHDVGPRDQDNGLEDKDLSDYSYWDGGIIKDEENGKYYMFASRWAQEDGHWGGDPDGGWRSSVAVYATSDNFYGPYEDQGLLWPDYYGGAGHNVFPFKLSENDTLYQDGYRYAIVVSDVFGRSEMNGRIQVSKSLNGPWTHLDKMNVDVNNFALSNISIMVRPDGKYEAINRNGDIATADSVVGEWTVHSTQLWWNVPGMPSSNVEDPVIWYSDGLYHCVANKWDAKRAYYLTSLNGLNNWTLQEGTAYTPQETFMSYEDGTENNWTKLERPNVYIEDGTLKAMTFAVIDVEKEADYGNDSHGSKIAIIPFDGNKLGEFANRRYTGALPEGDTNSQTWHDERDKNYGAQNFIQMQNVSSQNGMGETQGTDFDWEYDCKIGFLKYDISQYGTAEQIEHAKLSLVYLDKKAGDAKRDSVRVVLANPNWIEGEGREDGALDGELSGRNFPQLYYNVDDLVHTSAVSKPFETEEGLKVIDIDVTNLVKEFKEKYPQETYISFALNETEGGQRLHFGSKEAGDGYGAKLNIETKAAQNVDKSDLKELLKYAEDMMADETYPNVILAVRNAYEAAYADAKAVFENASALENEVKEVYERLLKAGHLLNWYRGDLTKLQAAYDKFAEQDLSVYTEETRKVLEAALQEAKEVLDLGENAVKEMIAPAYAGLQQAIFGLREIPNKDRLEELLGQAKEMDLSVYSVEAAKVVKAAVAMSEDIMADENASQKEVDAAVAALEDAVAAANAEVEDGVRASDKVVSVDVKKNTVQEKKPVKTGDETDAAVPAAAGIMAVLVAFVAWKKRTQA